MTQQELGQVSGYAPGMPDRFDRAIARALTWRYSLALALVAVLTIVAQVGVQLALRQSQNDGAVVNLAGRQRMLSQAMAKAALAWRTSSGPDQERWLNALRTTTAEWTSAHARLIAGDEPGMGVHNSPDIARQLAALDQVVAALASAAAALPEDPSAVERILAGESGFLSAMEQIVAAYDSDARHRVEFLKYLEIALCAMLLLILALEVLFVFRPAVARLQAALADRERLREREVANQVLEAAADVSRRIGQDLHDGLGQSLTAASLQARAIQRSLADHPAAIQAAALSETIAQVVADARAAARGLAPVVIQVDGLAGALRELAQVTSAGGIACRLDWLATLVPSGADEDCYRIAQEAVTNAIRHGKANSIVIRAKSSSGRFRLAVEDDGRWQPGKEGLGLTGMRWRAGRHGGTCRLGPGPGSGTAVEVELPLGPEAEAAPAGLPAPAPQAGLTTTAERTS